VNWRSPLKSATHCVIAAGLPLLVVSALLNPAQAVGRATYYADGSAILLAATDGMERRQDRREDRRDDRDDRQERREDCREDEGLVGKDKRDCKQRERRKDIILD